MESSRSRKKKIWSCDVLLETMKPSDKELEYRTKKLQQSDDLQKLWKLFQCTKCQKSFETILKKHEKVPVHPCLGVLMCEKCCDFYEDGEFSLDSEGEDKYCRWCGEGGTIFGCFRCICGFCAKCIRRHFNPEYFKKVQKDDKWLCFFCDPKPLWHLRYICSLAVEISKNRKKSNITFTSKKKEKNLSDSSSEKSKESLNCQSLSVKNRSRKRIYTSSSDDSENEIPETHSKKLKQHINSSEGSSKKKENNLFESVKTNTVKELEKILKLSEYQMSFGVSWSSKMLEKILNPEQIKSTKELLSECQKIKWFLSILSTYLVQFCNSIDSLEKNLLSETELKVPLELPDKEKCSYTTVLQFLGFVNNQIKTFMEKGISLSDVLEAEVYDDDNIIGIKKKINSLKNTFNQNLNIKSPSSKHFRGDEYEDSDSKEDTEEQRGDDDDRSRDENSLEIVLDHSSDMICTEGDEECKSLNCSNLTVDETNYLKNSEESGEDIKKILAILENA